MLKRVHLIFLLLTSIILFNNCSREKTEDENSTFNEKIIKDSADINRVKVIFYNVPSPVEMASILQRSGITYNPELLNPIKNVDKYLTSPKIAMNLGVYGADLSYVRMFDQMQESMSYLAVIKKFTEKLGIPSDKGQLTVGRLEDNLNNRDSLLSIISETYSNADIYLKENNRGSTAALIILGGWIEALFTATGMVEKPENSVEIMNRIAEQKFSLNNMIDLMNVYKSDEIIASYLPKLIELQKIYEKVTISGNNTKAETDASKKVTTLDTNSSIKITIENVKEINAYVSGIRAEITK